MGTLEFLVAAALVALHVQNPKKSFRQRDVRFFSELFVNWVEYSGRFESFRIHNNQIARRLTELAKKGAIKKKNVNGQTTYAVTSFGLVSCLQDILAMESNFGEQYIFFKIYFLSNYAPRIRVHLRTAESSIPTGLKLEIDPLLDWKSTIQQAIQRAEEDRKKLFVRIQDAHKMPAEVEKLLKKMSWEETVIRIEKLYPYELNSMRSLSELCAAVPEDLAKWELTVGSARRATQLWEPLLRTLENYIGELRKLLVTE